MDFILGLDTKMKAKVLRTVAILSENGPDLREPFTKPLNDGIFELRAKAGSDISRILFFFMKGHQIILTNGFIKKMQKTPDGEIKKAKLYREDYIRREGA